MKLYRFIKNEEVRHEDLVVVDQDGRLYFIREYSEGSPTEPSTESKKKIKNGAKIETQAEPKKTRKQKTKEYRCTECEDNFFSDAHYRSVACPACGKKNVLSV
jgi:DNA-directed RNA polymerase subunit RPC12/RpoP